jgi:type I restriction enzyme, S subunit
MKQGWEIKQLGDVCGFQNGFAFKSKTFKETGFPVLRISNIQKDKIDLNKIVFIDTSDYNEDLSKYMVKKNDLLIAMSGATTGKIGFNQTDDIFYLNQRVGKFEPAKELDKSYLYYFLSTKVEESLKISAGSAQPNLSTQQIKSFELPFPHLDEQKRIVAKLNQCFEGTDKARANVEKNLQNAKELFQSQLNEIFNQKGDGWEQKKLGELCEVITKGTTPTSVGFKFINEGINFVKVESISENGDFIPNKFAYITSECHKALKRSQLKRGDILFSIAGALGRTGIVTRNILPANTNQALSIIRLKDDADVLKQYLFFALSEGYALDQIEKFKGGVAQQNLSLTQMKSFEIPIPPLDEQKQIVHKLDELKSQTQSLESNYQQELDALDELKKSVLQKAFNGEL